MSKSFTVPWPSVVTESAVVSARISRTDSAFFANSRLRASANRAAVDARSAVRASAARFFSSAKTARACSKPILSPMRLYHESLWRSPDSRVPTRREPVAASRVRSASPRRAPPAPPPPRRAARAPPRAREPTPPAFWPPLRLGSPRPPAASSSATPRTRTNHASRLRNLRRRAFFLASRARKTTSARKIAAAFVFTGPAFGSTNPGVFDAGTERAMGITDARSASIAAISLAFISARTFSTLLGRSTARKRNANGEFGVLQRRRTVATPPLGERRSVPRWGRLDAC